jgi:predicted nucleic acid binding AN1-type Zn finger protein
MREHEGLKPALCEICGKEFTKWSYHDEHVKSEHQNAPLDVKCDFENCDRAFISVRLMKRHRRAVHTHKQKPPSGNAFVCHECGKAFSESARLKVNWISCANLKY